MKRFVTAFAIATLLMATSAAQAATATWDAESTSNNNWGGLKNWAADVVPSTSDHIVLTFADSSNQLSIFDSGAQASPYGDLTIGNNSFPLTFQVDIYEAMRVKRYVQG